MKKISIILSILILTTFYSIAQNDSIPFLNSDRPTQSKSPFLMQKGFFQVETGAVYVDRDDAEKQLERVRLGTTLLRYGVFPNFEIRLSDSYEMVHVFTKENSKDSTESGIGPVTAGFKVLVAHEKGIRPEMSILGSITFRHIGADPFMPTNSYPTGLLLCSHTITKQLSLGYNIGFSYNGESSDGFFIYSGYLGYYITSKLWVFAGAYGNFDHGDNPHDIDYSVNNLGNAGISYRFSRCFQIDISGGMAFDPGVDRYFASAGLSWRIPR
jgi:hypothetical protein